MPHNDLLDAIRHTALPLVPKEETLTTFCSGLRSKQVKKGEHLSRAGEVAENLFFVQDGLLRYYYLALGVEHTGQFFGEHSFVADVHSLTTGEFAQQNVDALEPTKVVCIPKRVLLEAYNADHAMERFGRRVIEQAMAGSQRRTAALLMRSPEQRYADLVARRPSIARTIPQYMIASYLGVTPESLSRIRRRRIVDS